MLTDSDAHEFSTLLENTQDTYSRKDLDDSIVYAKRIQDGMLLKEKHLHRIFPESFIYTRPRNIVSGDFYWFTRMGNKTIVAVADC
ncbi:MAG TPA: hypothetical protein VK783_00315, partial [Bacteroidia bacterium]|nr:hypothetical protein [Bacteroidia bacterium]